MANLERVHWFLRNQCNLERCGYCFGPLQEDKASPERDIQLAKVLVESGVKEVILGGGEPTLAKNLEEVMGILKDGGIYISLHTNGLLLTDEKLDGWKGLVNDIALPIDTVDRNVQEHLRGKGFMKVFDNLMEWANKINTRGIEVGWHTVFTVVNEDKIPGIYQLIKKQPFKYWRIYEYNGDLARQVWLTMKEVSDKEKIEGFLKARALEKLGTPEKGGTDCLLADFLRMEEKMKRLGDKRIRFVARVDSEEPYAFLENSGQMDSYTWYSDTKRKKLGNIFEDGFCKIGERWEKIRKMEEFDEGDFIETELEGPLWKRLYNGSYWGEEIGEVLPKHIPEVERLANLWQERNMEAV